MSGSGAWESSGHPSVYSSHSSRLTHSARLALEFPWRFPRPELGKEGRGGGLHSGGLGTKEPTKDPGGSR